jgi:membrane protease YdiL (CAAX protease family)
MNSVYAFTFFAVTTGILKLLEVSKISILKTLLPLLAAIMFLYIPTLYSVKKKDKEIVEIIKIKNLKTSMILCVYISIIIFPFYTAGFYVFHSIILGKKFLLHFPLDSPGNFITTLLFHIFIAALPEETFYRGFIQELFNRDFGKKWKIFKIEFGPSIFLTSILFALGHYIIIPHPFRLAVFFPSLLFGLLKEKYENITLPFLFHAIANIYSGVLESMFI